MKADFVDVSDTQKTLTVEIPSDLVDAEIDRIAKGYARQARLPGFRPGKAPASVIKQRFRDQIHHDVMHGLIPKAVEAVLTERGIEPVNTPNITNVAIHEGQTLQRLRERAGKLEPIDARPVADGDTLVADLERTDADGTTEPHNDVTLQVGSPANPPGFDANLIGMNAGETKAFQVEFPAEYAVKELAGTTVTYKVTVKEVRHRVLPELDDEFAKDVGAFDSLAALRDRRSEEH